ncbi:ATP-binding protein [Pseudoalteromonas umbrosa]|uniref:ATP-binding protein n=1 Tax=Pseudoalteromonas umbrosa TaxID=3048489 RepID=UPI0024C24D41|nr:ATP-binding protein [Pseudoalteromonas sp. B95]MDK1288021.1 ATP-binding protein [Pseudoalteromonas sp. B95]
MDSNTPHIITDLNLQIRFVSQAATELLNKKKLIGLDLKEIFEIESITDDLSIGSYQSHRFIFNRYSCQNGYCFLLQEQKNNTEHLDFLVDAISSSSIGIWRYNIETKTIYLSDISKRILGINPNIKLTWRKLLSLVHCDDRALFPLFFENHVQFGVPLQFEFRLKLSGQKSWFALKGSCLHKSSEQWINGTLQDCTVEKTTVIALNDADESKQLAIEAGKIGTWRATKSGHQWLWKWDMLANNIFKLSPEDIGDLDKWVELLHPEDKPRVQIALEESLRTGVEFKQHYRSILKSGEVIYVFAQGRVGKNYKGEYCRIDGVCVDQTEIHTTQLALKRLNSELETRVNDRTAELHKTLQKAEQANKIKSEFLSMISHELRTPLNGIIGALDLLSHSTLSHEPKDLVETASTSANHLITILNDLLDLNKIEAGKLELETVKFDLPSVITNVVNTFSATAKEKDIELNIFESFTESVILKGDENRFLQVLLNILSNAVKFTNCDSVPIKKITVKTHVNKLNIYQSEVIVTVSDSGVGMSSETIQKLFTPFTQAEKSTTRKFGGTGLGLSICGKLIDLMGGKISVESELGVGSQFTITAPFWLELAEGSIEEKSALNCYLIGTLSEKNQHILQLLECAFAVNIIDLENNQITPNSEIKHNVVLTNELERFSKHIEMLSKIHKVIVYSDRSLVELIALSAPFLAVFSNQPITLKLLEKQINAQQQEQLLIEDFSLDFDTDDSIEASVNEEDNPLVAEYDIHDILLVEDNPFNQKLIKSQLAKLGLSCDVANNGAEGFNFWHSGTYKLILTDCHMPKVDGYEMTKQIRTEEAKTDQSPVPIIAVTGAVMQGERDLCTSIGMNDFLCKPIRLHDIKSIMERWYEHST